MLSRSEIYIDLGTTSTLIYHAKQGLILNEPSTVTLYRQGVKKDQMFAVGKAAKQMLEKTPERLEVISPLARGVIVDITNTEKMLAGFFKAVLGSSRLKGSKVIVSLPRMVTDFERKAVAEVIKELGAAQIFLLDEPLAAAVGAHHAIEDIKVNMIADIGGGTTEVAAIACGGIVHAHAVRVGGDDMDHEIIHWLHEHKNFKVGLPTAEKIKMALGSAIMPFQTQKARVRGIDLNRRMPGEIEISNFDVYEAIRPVVQKIARTILESYVALPDEAATDVAARGLTIAGGCCLLHHFDEMLADTLGMNVERADDALLAISAGGAKILHSPGLCEKICQRAAV
jgi:rod shape-determining protein MreB